MLSTRSLFFIFVPAILVVGLAFAIRVIQFEPLYPEQATTNASDTSQPAIIPILPDDPILGDKKAPITIVAFKDFGCPACKEQSMILNELLKKHEKKVKIIWKGLPVTTFPYPSETAQHYGYCANKQGKFTEFKEYAFANSDNLSPMILEQIVEATKIDTAALKECLDSSAPEAHLTQTEQLATTLRIGSVPSLFVDNKLITAPPVTVEGWESILNLE